VVERGLGHDYAPSYPRERKYLVLAKVLLARPRTRPSKRPADTLARRPIPKSAPEARWRSGHSRRLPSQAARQHTRAGAVLREVLTLSQPQGHVRVCADEGPPMAALLQRLTAADNSLRRGHNAPGAIPVYYLGRLSIGVHPGCGRARGCTARV
jgi:LuxR family maltose regulon positive regulatory protein